MESAATVWLALDQNCFDDQMFLIEQLGVDVYAMATATVRANVKQKAGSDLREEAFQYW